MYVSQTDKIIDRKILANVSNSSKVHASISLYKLKEPYQL